MAWGTKNNPNKSGRYLVTLKSEVGRRHVGIADWYEYAPGKFAWAIVAAGFGEIIAWKKMPDPFEGDMSFGEKMARRLIP